MIRSASRLFYFSLALLALALTAPANAEWRTYTAPLPQDPPIKLVASPEGLLILHARQLTVLHAGGQVRRAYILHSQTDGLVDLVRHGGTWLLASRRTVLSSDDKGFSWRTLDTLPARDPNEWMAVQGFEGLVLGASGYGVKRVEPGLSTAWGPAGHDALVGAVSGGGALAFETGDGLFAVTVPTVLQRLQLPRPFGLTAILPTDRSLWIAGSRGVSRCAPDCGMFSGPPGLRDLTVYDGEPWGASPGGVFRWSAGDAAWHAEVAGLGQAAPGSLALWNGTLWLLAEGRLFQWHAAQATAGVARPADHPLSHPLRGPAMEDVRRMVLAAHPFVPDDAASWRKRVRWRAAAPTVGFSVRQGAEEKSGRTLGNTVGLSTTEARILIGPEGESTTRTSGRGTDYGLALTWHLDELVFNSQELSVNGEAEESFKLRKTLMLDVTRLYYDRLRMLAERGRALDEVKQIELEIRVDELTADLDFYTGGRFSRALLHGTGMGETR